MVPIDPIEEDEPSRVMISPQWDALLTEIAARDADDCRPRDVVTLLYYIDLVHQQLDLALRYVEARNEGVIRLLAGNTIRDASGRVVIWQGPHEDLNKNGYTLVAQREAAMDYYRGVLNRPL